MTKKEIKQIQNEFSKYTLDIYAGILFNNQQFEEGNQEEIQYNIACEEFKELREKYDLVNIAGKGSELKRAKRLLHYLAPRLKHSPWYDNHIECNAMALLEYSLNKPENGINCLSKSKILTECCLALGIYARRVAIMPYSPYDFDNHVVVEIYDTKLNKWIMLDPTTDGFFVDECGMPLSVLEMRNKFAEDAFVTFVLSTDRLKDLKALQEKYIEQSAYICKNLFYFYIDQDNTFGDKKRRLAFVPKNYIIKDKLIANIKYRINHLPQEYEEYKKEYQNKLELLKEYKEDERTNISSMIKSPL